jgi:hypothetical protein
MFIWPAVENAFSVKDSSDGRGVRAQIHDQSCAGPCRSTEDVRTVSRRRRGKGASRSNGRSGHGRRYSVSSATRAGSEVRMSGMALLGAPFSRRSRRRESWESTAIKMVSGTPAHRYVIHEVCYLKESRSERPIRTPSSNSVSVLPRRGAQPCRTRGGPSMHHIVTFCKSGMVFRKDHVSSPRSLLVRSVSARRGRSRRIPRKDKKTVGKADVSSTHVKECRFSQRRRALRTTPVTVG